MDSFQKRTKENINSDWRINLDAFSASSVQSDPSEGFFGDLRGWKSDCIQVFSLVHCLLDNKPSTNTAKQVARFVKACAAIF